MKKSIVSVIRCDDYNYENVKSSIEKSIDNVCNINKVLKNVGRVLIKPNVCSALSPEKADTTHPLVLKAIIDVLKKNKKNIHIIIGESGAGGIPEATDKAFEIAGIKKIAFDSDIELCNFSKLPFVKKKIRNGKVLKQISITKSVFDVDFVINVPKIKTHNLTFLTGAIKNLFGCVKKREREELHKIDPLGQTKFSQALIDIYSVIRPKVNLNIIDGVIGIEGLGTPIGNPVKIGLILASKDAVALDAVVAKIVGFNSPSEIPTIRYAHERRLGVGSISQIDIVGEEINEVRLKKFELPVAYTKRREVKLVPFFTENCIKCGSCKINCPTKSITLKPRQKINRKSCINCLCCYEACENRGIGIMELPLNKIIYLDGKKYYVSNDKLMILDEEKMIELCKKLKSRQNFIKKNKTKIGKTLNSLKCYNCIYFIRKSCDGLLVV